MKVPLLCVGKSTDVSAETKAKLEGIYGGEINFEHTDCSLGRLDIVANWVQAKGVHFTGPLPTAIGSVPITTTDADGKLVRLKGIVPLTEPFPIPIAPSDEFVRLEPKVYFGGRVMSIWYINRDGVAVVSLGQMLPGEYDFGTTTRREYTEVLDGWIMINGKKYRSERKPCLLQAGEPAVVSTTVHAAWITRFSD